MTKRIAPFDLDTCARWAREWPAQIRALPPGARRDRLITAVKALGRNVSDPGARETMARASVLQRLAHGREQLLSVEKPLLAMLEALGAFQKTGTDWLNGAQPVGTLTPEHLRGRQRFLAQCLAELSVAIAGVDEALRTAGASDMESSRDAGLDLAALSPAERARFDDARRAALSAFRYQRVALVIGANNRAESTHRTGTWADQSVERMRREDGAYRRDDDGHWRYVRPKKYRDMGTGLEEIAAMARRAEEFRAGNCGEHAAVVFEYLRRRSKGLRISYCVCLGEGDHAFVTINRGPSVHRPRFSRFDAHAIVVDGWGGFVCTKGQIDAGAMGFLDYDLRKPVVLAGQQYIARHDAEIQHEVET